jgi:hypothetical protein
MPLTCKKKHPKDGQIQRICNSNNVRQKDKKITKNKAMVKGATIATMQDKK